MCGSDGEDQVCVNDGVMLIRRDVKHKLIVSQKPLLIRVLVKEGN